MKKQVITANTRRISRHIYDVVTLVFIVMGVVSLAMRDYLPAIIYILLCIALRLDSILFELEIQNKFVEIDEELL